MENHTITVTIGTPGRSIDTEELYNLVTNAFTNGDYSDIDFDYDMTYPATVQLDTLYEQMTTEPKNAEYNPDTDSVEAETVGYTPAVALDEAEPNSWLWHLPGMSSPLHLMPRGPKSQQNN